MPKYKGSVKLVLDTHRDGFSLIDVAPAASIAGGVEYDADNVLALIEAATKAATEHKAVIKAFAPSLKPSKTGKTTSRTGKVYEHTFFTPKLLLAADGVAPLIMQPKGVRFPAPYLAFLAPQAQAGGSTGRRKALGEPTEPKAEPKGPKAL